MITVRYLPLGAGSLGFPAVQIDDLAARRLAEVGLADRVHADAWGLSFAPPGISSGVQALRVTREAWDLIKELSPDVRIAVGRGELVVEE